MQRLRRWLFNFAAAVSLVMCMATLMLWLLWGEAKLVYGIARLKQDSSTTEFFFRLAIDLVPYWLVIIPTSFLPLFWLTSYTLNWRERRRLSKLGVCEYCGYDLRATPDRCPECGMVPTGAATSRPV